MRSPLQSLFLILALTLLFGAVIFFYSVWPKEPPVKVQSQNNSSGVLVNNKDVSSFNGRVLGEENVLGLTVRRMVDGQGQLVAWLQSGQIDLRILQPNLSVVVEGRIAKILEGNKPLILVDKLSFR